MAEVQSVRKTYEKGPGLLRRVYSWEQSNAIMERVITAVQGIYIEADISRQPSSFERRRYDSITVRGGFFELALEYVAHEGKRKDKVVARLIPIGHVDYGFTRLDEVVRHAMR